MKILETIKAARIVELREIMMTQDTPGVYDWIWNFVPHEHLNVALVEISDWCGDPLLEKYYPLYREARLKYRLECTVDARGEGHSGLGIALMDDPEYIFHLLKRLCKHLGHDLFMSETVDFPLAKIKMAWRPAALFEQAAVSDQEGFTYETFLDRWATLTPNFISACINHWDG
jgi:hypothetical protein